MTTGVVTNSIVLPDGTIPAYVYVKIELLGATGAPLTSAFVTATGTLVDGASHIHSTTGQWSATLQLNTGTNLTPSGTMYRITQMIDRYMVYVDHISVSGSGTMASMLTAGAPSSLAPAGAQQYADNAVAAAMATAALRVNNLSDLASASSARSNLGLGSIATQGAESVSITGGTITGIADLAVADGGTGASTAAVGLGNLGGVAHQARGNRAVFLGDSLTIGQETIAPNYRSISYPVYASVNSKQQIWYIRNAGIGGNTSEDMLARFDTDVTPYAPSVVFVLAGTNDMGSMNNWAISRSITALTAIYQKCRQIGATPIVCTMPPNTMGSPVDRQKRVIGLNAWLRRHAQQNGYPLVDFYKLFVNPADGTWISAYSSGDGTHPNHVGYQAMGAYAATSLASELRPTYPPLPQDNVDGNNLIVNGLFLGDANSDGLADSWSKAGTGGTVSLVTGDSSIQGNWQQVVSNNNLTAMTIFQTISTGIVPGHVYAHTGRFQFTGFANAVTASLRFLWNGVSEGTPTGTYEIRSLSACEVDVPDGSYYIEHTAPFDATTVQINYQLRPGTGTMKLAQAGFYDLTAMGLA